MEEHNQPNNKEQANANRTLPENVLLEKPEQNKNGLFIVISMFLLFLSGVFLFIHIKIAFLLLVFSSITIFFFPQKSKNHNDGCLLTIQIIFGVIIFLIWIITLFLSALRI